MIFGRNILLAALLTVQVWPADPIWIVAHRGAKNAAPENTIAAFDAAADRGANYVELDVRPTKEGELVLMHDATVDRTTNGKGAVSSLTLADIRKLDAGNAQHVPTFREALLWGKRRGVKIDVDHKDGDIEAIAKVIRETGMVREVVIEGPVSNLKQFAALLPGVATMPKVASVARIAGVCGMPKTTVVRVSAQEVRDPAAVAAVRACPARVSFTILGTTDNFEEMRRVTALGAQLIETDHPEVLAKVREEAR